MMGEEGFYASDQELFFQRVHLLWRAMRILLDVGLHTRGMTREQAVDQMLNELHVERGNAEAEVRRYCAWPAYQLCYAVGRRELLRLRDDFRKARGHHFTLRDRKSTRLNSSHLVISYAVFCLKKKIWSIVARTS